MNLQKLLTEEIENRLSELQELEVGTEKYNATVSDLTKLLDRAIEMEKFDKEHEEKVLSREIEQNLKKKQLDDERKDRIVKNSITIGGIVIPLGVTIWGTLKTLKFEEEGTITTIMGRGFINKLLPKK